MEVETHVVHLEDDVAWQPGGAEPGAKRRTHEESTRKQRNSAANHRNPSKQQQQLSTHHAWALDEPCRTDADMAAALPGTLRQATIRSKKKEKTSPVAV